MSLRLHIYSPVNLDVAKIRSDYARDMALSFFFPAQTSIIKPLSAVVQRSNLCLRHRHSLTKYCQFHSGKDSASEQINECACVCLPACMYIHACVCTCAHMCECVCMYAYMHGAGMCTCMCVCGVYCMLRVYVYAKELGINHLYSVQLKLHWIFRKKMKSAESLLLQSAR